MKTIRRYAPKTNLGVPGFTRHAMAATLYSLIPAIIAAYGWYWWFEGFAV